MCIYYGNKETLTYTNKEHIFPACIGGVHTLPHNYVSDQANKLFSKLELKFARGSTIALPRILFGPGKRGSLETKKETKSQISVFNDDNGKSTLGYISKGKPYLISQAIFDGENLRLIFDNDKGSVEEKHSTFINALKYFNGEYISISFDDLGNKNAILGYFDKKFYFVNSTDKNISVEEIVSLSIMNTEIKNKPIIGNIDSPQMKFEFSEYPDISRVYAKTALNVLAKIKGSEYLANSAFDDFKSWITTGKSIRDYNSFSRIESIPIAEHCFTVNNKFHYCVFIKTENKIISQICFYGKIYRMFCICDAFDNSFDLPVGYICDWEKREEKTYIANISDVLEKEARYEVN